MHFVPAVVLVLAYPGGHGEHVYESTSGVHVVNGSHGFRVAQKSITGMQGNERMSVEEIEHCECFHVLVQLV